MSIAYLHSIWGMGREGPAYKRVDMQHDIKLLVKGPNCKPYPRGCILLHIGYTKLNRNTGNPGPA
jgi:hypothetical protein